MSKLKLQTLMSLCLTTFYCAMFDGFRFKLVKEPTVLTIKEWGKIRGKGNIEKVQFKSLRV